LVVTEPKAAGMAMDRAVDLLGPESGMITLGVLLRRQPALLSMAASSGYLISELEEEIEAELEQHCGRVVARAPKHIGIRSVVVDDRCKKGLRRLVDDTAPDTAILAMRKFHRRRRTLARSLDRFDLAADPSLIERNHR
jgi:hypothetical protein